MKYFNIALCSLLLFLFTWECKKDEAITFQGYSVSGKVMDAQGAGIQNIKIKAGANNKVTTDAQGHFQITNLQGIVTLVPEDSTYLLTPLTLSVSAANDHIVFTGRRKSIPGLVPEKVLAWFNALPLPNGLVETSEHSNLVSLYDNALAALVFIATGENEKAEAIFNYFNNRINSELLAGKGGFSQFRDANGTPNGHNWLGDNAWMLIALNNYAAKVNNTKYQNLISQLSAWIQSLQDTDGGLWGGYNADGTKIGKITEGMIDAFDAVPGYTAFHANLLQYIEADRWDPTEHLLVSWPGNTYKFAMDNHSWGYCAFEDFPYSVLEKTSMYMNTQTATLTWQPISGFAPDIDKDVVWIEGTGQMAVAYQKSGHFDLANYYLNEMQKLVVSSLSYADTKSLACVSNIGTGYGTDLFWAGADQNPCTAASAWFIMAMLQFDPMAVGYTKNIPIGDKFWLP